jgi:hypothetical protein
MTVERVMISAAADDLRVVDAAAAALGHSRSSYLMAMGTKPNAVKVLALVNELRACEALARELAGRLDAIMTELGRP